jgi:hypothetical protein
MDSKPTEHHFESKQHDKAEIEHDHVVLKSQEDNLTVWQTCVRYRKVSRSNFAESTLKHQAVIICTLLCIAAACDGYQINLNGMLVVKISS